MEASSILQDGGSGGEDEVVHHWCYPTRLNQILGNGSVSQNQSRNFTNKGVGDARDVCQPFRPYLATIELAGFLESCGCIQFLG
jgi:hypothetical protein